MTSKERVLATISHQEPDRVPIDFGATMETTIHAEGYKKLIKALDIQTAGSPVEMLKTAGFVRPDEDVQQHIGADVRGLFPNRRYSGEGRLSEDGEYKLLTDEFGILWRKPVDGGLYYDIHNSPMSNMQLDDIKNYNFPDPRNDKIFENVDTLLANVNINEYPVVYDNCFGNGIFQSCNQLMGYDTYLMAMALSEPRADYLMDKILEMKLEFWDEVLTRFGDKVDIVKELDDMGTQINLLISPDMYKQHIKPRLKKLVDFIKSKKPEVKMMMHSCGSVSKIIPDLIDCGIEILNPVQYTAAEMDPVMLKREFGADLTFWGGGVDTQTILPRGTADEVSEEVKRMLELFMPGGGFVFAPIHAIQADVPAENILAMWETVREYGIY
ncbi:MAG: uroporphyrinogen decarboxylase family protein [Spirochaetales bacterium]|uniref:Uroporphyrinogen decarboxylase family protein n=1 Tax=Candidatus Thalassospirochaeta sargassi TaxID=3119039 RepID=A0AAJ1MN34_9SPIO|nr:uroporphyrinogen decarboxylase family protein [Spirochaetales bacterium]